MNLFVPKNRAYPRRAAETAPPNYVAHIQRLAREVAPGSEGDTVFEQACDAGRQMRDDMDERRWTLGDLAALLKDRYPTFEDSYGKGIIENFAREVFARARTIYEYHETARFYPAQVRIALAQTFPTLAYSHYRAAMRLTSARERADDPNAALSVALSFLGECGAEGWTVDQADREIRQRKGSAGKPKPVMEFVAVAYCDENGWGYVTDGERRYLMALDLAEGKTYRVLVYEVEA